MVKYIVLVDYSSGDLEKSVAFKLELGWQLHGGVSVAQDNHLTKFCQAMIKVEENK